MNFFVHSGYAVPGQETCTKIDGFSSASLNLKKHDDNVKDFKTFGRWCIRGKYVTE